MRITRITNSTTGGAPERGASWALWSPDGRTIAFVTDARDLAGRAPVPGNDDDIQDVFLHDTATGATRQVTFSGSSIGANVDLVAFSADGATLFFNSTAQSIAPGDVRQTWVRDDVFAVDVASGTVGRVTAFDGKTISAAAKAVSPDGWLVLLETSAPVGPGDVVPEDSGSPAINDGDYEDDVVLLDRATGSLTRLTSDAAGNPPDLDSTPVAFSPDARWVLFESRATNLAGVAGADFYNATYFTLAGTLIPIWTFFDHDVFLYDRTTGGTFRVTTKANGDAVNAAGDAYGFSPDGRYVLFDTSGGDVRGVTGADANDTSDAFVFDMATATARRISNDAAGNAPNESTEPVAFAGDSRTVLVESRATNLAGVTGADANGTSDVFVIDVATGAARRVSNDAAGNAANGQSQAVAISPDGRRVLFESQASNLAGQSGARYERDQWDLFVADLATNTITRLSTNAAGRPAGSQEYDGRRDPPAGFSPDGTRVVFGTGSDGADPKDIAGLRAAWGTLFVADLAAAPARPRQEGGPGNDALTGTAAGDDLVGRGGNDTLMGMAGDDVLDGGPGTDILHGGPGRDVAMAYESGARGVAFQPVQGGTVMARPTGERDGLIEVEEVRFLDGRVVFDAADPVAVVTRLYQAGLGRAPDPAGREAWTAQLLAGVPAKALADAFAFSPEFAARAPGSAPGGDPAAFVDALYANVLGRAPDAPGRAYWTGVLTSGALDHGGVLLAFSDGAENLARAAPTLARGLWDADDAAAAVMRLYAATLGRAPDQGGLRSWMGEIAAGRASVPSVAEALSASPEFAGRFPGAGDPGGFVATLYRNSLGREPDADGLAYWAWQVSIGLPRASAVLAFSESAEHVARTVPMLEGGIAFA